MQLLLFSRVVIQSFLLPETVLTQLQKAQNLIDVRLPAFDPQHQSARYPFAFEVETPVLSRSRGTQGRGYVRATPTGSQIRLCLRPAWSSLGILGISWAVCGFMLQDSIPLFLAPTSTTLEASNVILPSLLAVGVYGVLLLGFVVETRRVRRLLTQILNPPSPKR